MRTCVVLAVLSVTVLLSPLAFASPPDQTWIRGFYDDSDFDDVILIVTGGTPAIACEAMHDVAPGAVVVLRRPDVAESLAPSAPLASHGSRAPPA
jgi:hypothetical protein